MLFVYHESLKRELKTKPVYEFRFDERLKTKVYYEAIKRELNFFSFIINHGFLESSKEMNNFIFQGSEN